MKTGRSLALRWKLMIPFGVLSLLWAATGTAVLARAAGERARTRTNLELAQQSRNAGFVFSDLAASHIELVRLAANTEGMAEAAVRGDYKAAANLLEPLLLNSRADFMAVFDDEGRERLGIWRNKDRAERARVKVVPVEGATLTGPGEKAVVLTGTERGAALTVVGSVRRERLKIGFIATGTLAPAVIERLEKGGSGIVGLYDPSGRLVGSSRGAPVIDKSRMRSGSDGRLRTRGSDALLGDLIARGETVGRFVTYVDHPSLSLQVWESAGGLVPLGGLAVFAVIAVGLLISSYITRSLGRVAVTAEQIASGDLSRRAEGATGDEIGSLVASFNTMADRLEESHRELERRVAERTDELKRANEELAGMAQTKSEFLANMSHELRTPLNAIIGYSEMLADPFFGAFKPVEVRKHAKAINQSGQHLLNLINDILDISKIEAGRLDLEIEQVDVRGSIRNSLRLVEPMAVAKGVRIRTRVSGEVETVPADDKRLRQILLNLLSNAVKFTPPDGSVVVSASKQNLHVVFAVTDTGVGIAEEHQHAIFQQFRQVSSAVTDEEGTGLGLALARQLVELHGGEISVESAIGEGSKFTFTLPLKTKRGAARG